MGLNDDTEKELNTFLFCFVLDRQISQEDKNWEQNIQELQKKVLVHASAQTHRSAHGGCAALIVSQ